MIDLNLSAAGHPNTENRGRLSKLNSSPQEEVRQLVKAMIDWAFGLVRAVKLVLKAIRARMEATASLLQFD